MNTDYTYFECVHEEGPNQIDDMNKDAAIACAYVDGYPSDENQDGTVICTIWLTTEKKFIVDWHHNGYRLNDEVLGLIANVKDDLMRNYGQD